MSSLFNLLVKLVLTRAFCPSGAIRRMEKRILRYGAPKIHSFLRHFAIDVDPERLQVTLPITIVTRRKPKPGLAFKVLLQQLDRQIDWRFATELENRFLNG